MNNYDTTKWNEYLMKINGLSAGLNMPTASTSIGSGASEAVHGLPPYHRRKAFLVDEYPACPSEWPRSTGRIKSYFVPIIEGHGLWLDFNKCLESVPQHVAMVVSMQGINVITGLPCKDPTMEQYVDQCPKHKKPFGADRYCADCGYKWPKQNYLSSTGTPEGALWIDGFVAEDGVVRQYVLTESKSRGVAAHIVGEDRVFAMGISFFLSTQHRPAPVVAPRTESIYSKGIVFTGSAGYTGDTGVDDVLEDKCCMMSLCDTGIPDPNEIPLGTPAPSVSVNYVSSDPSMTKYCADFGTSKGGGSLMMSGGTKGMTLGESGSSLRARKFAALAAAAVPAGSPVTVKKREIAAGARINQRIYDDPVGLDYWQREPEGIIVINYCSEAEADAIIAGGKVEAPVSKEGFLTQIPVGNKV